MEVQIHFGLGRICEWLGLAGNAQGAAVNCHSQQRLDEDIDIGGHVGDERNVELYVLHGMLLAKQLVVESHLTVIELDIGNGEP